MLTDNHGLLIKHRVCMLTDDHGLFIKLKELGHEHRWLRIIQWTKIKNVNRWLVVVH